MRVGGGLGSELSDEDSDIQCMCGGRMNVGRVGPEISITYFEVYIYSILKNGKKMKTITNQNNKNAIT